MSATAPILTKAPQANIKADDGNTGQTQYAGWYTLRLDGDLPDECVCGSINVRFPHTSARHSKIVVWPEKDDDVLLKLAIAVKKSKRSVRVIEYEPQMGRCITSKDATSAHI